MVTSFIQICSQLPLVHLGTTHLRPRMLQYIIFATSMSRILSAACVLLCQLDMFARLACGAQVRKAISQEPQQHRFVWALPLGQPTGWLRFLTVRAFGTANSDYIRVIGNILGLYGDNGNENETTIMDYTGTFGYIMGLYMDNGKEKGNYRDP